MAEIKWIRKAGSGPSMLRGREPATQSTTVPSEDLGSMTVADLTTVADRLGIDISECKKKADLVETITAAVQARANGEDD